MIQRYELWLDESGDFIQEQKKKDKKQNPSLVGGILLKKDTVSKIDFEGLIGDSGGHSCEMTSELKEKVVLPALVRLQTEYDVKYVFFENTRYEEERSNRQLYLRIISEGILQLLLLLDAVEESVELSVLIAQRQDMTAEDGEQRIDEEEYQNWLKQEIDKKCADKKILLHSDTKLIFTVRPAYKEKKLQLADFACNTRFTRTSRAFQKHQDILRELFEDSYIFTLHELGSANYIKRALSADSISDAIMELCTTKDNLDIKMQTGLIRKRMDSMSYFLVKKQVNQCITDIEALILKTEDYVVGVRILNKILNEVLPELTDSKFPVENLIFTVQLQLIDMLLRAGNIILARIYMEQCKITEKNLENSLENLLRHYQCHEKEAVLCIDEFDYHTAVDIMEKAVKSFENLMDAVLLDDGIQTRFPTIKSEYYGDALCMLLYAKMFLQRDNPDSYKNMCCLSDIALQQYPNIDAELERHRQYRCHIEAEAGNYQAALSWLILAKGIESENPNKKEITQFLIAIKTTESKVSCQYYLMYYLHVMAEAKISGNEIADTMYQCLVSERDLCENMGLLVAKNQTQYEFQVDINRAQKEHTETSYHPQEIICWKYATYLFKSGNHVLADNFYHQALNHCSQSEFLTMRITSFGIFSERICCLLEAGNDKAALRQSKTLEQNIDKVQQEILTENTQQYIETMKQILIGAGLGTDQLQGEGFWMASRKLTY